MFCGGSSGDIITLSETDSSSITQKLIYEYNDTASFTISSSSRSYYCGNDKTLSWPLINNSEMMPYRYLKVIYKLNLTVKPNAYSVTVTTYNSFSTNISAISAQSNCSPSNPGLFNLTSTANLILQQIFSSQLTYASSSSYSDSSYMNIFTENSTAPYLKITLGSSGGATVAGNWSVQLYGVL